MPALKVGGTLAWQSAIDTDQGGGIKTTQASYALLGLMARYDIDKSFVRDLAHSAGDQAIASSIIGLAHRLKLRVIAEGVETEQQRGFLRANGCDEMQGYLFSEPLPPAQLAALLARSTGAASAARRGEVAA